VTGIWSKVRTQLLGKSEPAYSNYTVRVLLRRAAKSAAACVVTLEMTHTASPWKKRQPHFDRTLTLPLPSLAQCYTGIADFIPADIDTVGYRVFLGNKCAHARAHADVADDVPAAPLTCSARHVALALIH
jgi:hypothetical protein